MRILFITANRLGDAVLSTGLLNHLARRYPDAAITVATGPVPAPLFDAAPCVAHIISMEKRRFAGHWLSLWLKSIGARWDMVIDLRRSALGWLLWTRERKSIPPPDHSCHRVRFIARTLGLEDDPPPPILWHGEGHLQQAAQ
ncbi:MAG: glycosyltransferase family 9 protein, partial [Proteobacteria bacterium]|nr:glycosyltransferase family 9 protein [Pseudomonadota bacterium]